LMPSKYYFAHLTQKALHFFHLSPLPRKRQI
jgi:hypothetical protein